MRPDLVPGVGIEPVASGSPSRQAQTVSEQKPTASVHPPSLTNACKNPSDNLGTESGPARTGEEPSACHTGAKQEPNGKDLAELKAAWPDLPVDVRAKVLALVRGAAR